MTFGEKVIRFNKTLKLEVLPEGIRALNPFCENPEVLPITEQFYRKYYSDNQPRRMIIGINPGRFGAGATGIPFTDTRRLFTICGIRAETIATHEPSSVFMYEMIDRFGGPEKFYSRYYIQSVCPLGFVKQNLRGNFVNYNYYDSEELFLAVKPFIIEKLKEQIRFGIETETGFILGKKNYKYFEKLNSENHFFRNIVMLEHPRYIVQYKLKQKEMYLEKYLDTLNKSL